MDNIQLTFKTRREEKTQNMDYNRSENDTHICTAHTRKTTLLWRKLLTQVCRAWICLCFREAFKLGPNLWKAATRLTKQAMCVKKDRKRKKNRLKLPTGIFQQLMRSRQIARDILINNFNRSVIWQSMVYSHFLKYSLHENHFSLRFPSIPLHWIHTIFIT